MALMKLLGITVVVGCILIVVGCGLSMFPIGALTRYGFTAIGGMWIGWSIVIVSRILVLQRRERSK